MKIYFITLLLFVAWIPQTLADALPEVPHIVVAGEYEIQTVPDILTLSLSIAETGFEVAAARDSVESRSKKLIHSLEVLEIKKEDINSAQLQITPHYNWNKSEQIYAGTEVSRSIVVTLKDLSRYDELIRAIIEARVAQINSTVLSSSKEKQLREDALRGAIENGLEKAQIMVAQLSEGIGPVYSISQQPSYSPASQARYQMADMAKQSAFEPGSITFKESLQIVFYLVKEK